MIFIVALLLFVVVLGLVDARIPWPRPGHGGGHGGGAGGSGTTGGKGADGGGGA